MKPFHGFVFAAAALLVPLAANPALAQGQAPPSSITEKVNAYVGCINQLSARAYDSRKRYFSWVAKSGPTGKERIIYGLYTIYDTSDCRKTVEKANALEPHDAALEAAATAYADAVSDLEPLLKQADDYYSQQDYKDDRMAKGKALHPRLVAAWDAFARADEALRGEVDAINDKQSSARLAESRSARRAAACATASTRDDRATRVLRGDGARPDAAAITKALETYEDAVKAAERASSDDSSKKIGSIFIGDAKSFLATAKQLMRRLRDHVPYSTGDKMMLDAGSGWMVEGSPQRLMRDYNQLVDAYNRGANI